MTRKVLAPFAPAPMGADQSPAALQAAMGLFSQQVFANIVPKGIVVAWFGSTSVLPDGWALCDGTNGTPDLRDRFIVGAGASFTVGATGTISAIVSVGGGTSGNLSKYYALAYIMKAN